MTENIRPFNNISPTLDDTVYIDQSAVVIGQTHLEKDVSIWPLTVIRGDVNFIEIGPRSNIQDGSVIHVSRPTTNNPKGHPVIIGSDVTVGHKVMLHGCQIGNRVLIGIGAIILDGVIIEDNVIVGAGSLVTPNKRLQSGYLYTGSPARQKRALTEKELEYFVISANNYCQLKNDYL
jgi:carbonic anhydrase/acetyltransferase-like protein (isoleucine patch superfamily)